MSVICILTLILLAEIALSFNNCTVTRHCEVTVMYYGSIKNYFNKCSVYVNQGNTDRNEKKTNIDLQVESDIRPLEKKTSLVDVMDYLSAQGWKVDTSIPMISSGITEGQRLILSKDF